MSEKKSALTWLFIIGIGFNLFFAKLGIDLAYAQTCIGGGNLAITSFPATANFPTVNASTQSQTQTITFSPSINFEDMRNVTATFAISISGIDYERSSPLNTFSVTNLSIATDDNDTIGQVECDPNTGITVAFLTPSAFTDGDSNGVSDTKDIVTADSRARIGKYSIEPQLELTVPGGVTVGTYRTTLTFIIE